MKLLANIPIFIGAEIEAKLFSQDDKGYLKYFYKGKEFSDDAVMGSIDYRIFEWFVFISRGICHQNNISLWDY